MFFLFKKKLLEVIYMDKKNHIFFTKNYHYDFNYIYLVRIKFCSDTLLENAAAQHAVVWKLYQSGGPIEWDTDSTLI